MSLRKETLNTKGVETKPNVNPEIRKDDRYTIGVGGSPCSFVTCRLRCTLPKSEGREYSPECPIVVRESWGPGPRFGSKWNL